MLGDVAHFNIGGDAGLKTEVVDEDIGARQESEGGASGGQCAARKGTCVVLPGRGEVECV